MSSLVCCRQPRCSLLGCAEEPSGATELLGVGWAGAGMGSEETAGTACSPTARCFLCLPVQPVLGDVLPGAWLMFCSLFLQVFSFDLFFFLFLNLCEVLRASATCCFPGLHTAFSLEPRGLLSVGSSWSWGCSACPLPLCRAV